MALSCCSVEVALWRWPGEQWMLVSFSCCQISSDSCRYQPELTAVARAQVVTTEKTPPNQTLFRSIENLGIHIANPSLAPRNEAIWQGNIADSPWIAEGSG